MEYIETLGANAKTAEPAISVMGTNEKNRVLSEISSLLRSHVTEIIGANKLDIETARANGMSEAMIDRLTLTEQRIGGMADGVDKVISLPDPVGAVIGGSDLPNGLHVIKKRVPIGTIGIIFESRPNVTVDAATLCFKAGNTVILRGGSDAIPETSFSSSSSMSFAMRPISPPCFFAFADFSAVALVCSAAC